MKFETLFCIAGVLSSAIQQDLGYGYDVNTQIQEPLAKQRVQDSIQDRLVVMKQGVQDAKERLATQGDQRSMQDRFAIVRESPVQDQSFQDRLAVVRQGAQDAKSNWNDRFTAVPQDSQYDQVQTKEESACADASEEKERDVKIAQETSIEFNADQIAKIIQLVQEFQQEEKGTLSQGTTFGQDSFGKDIAIQEIPSQNDIMYQDKNTLDQNDLQYQTLQKRAYGYGFATPRYRRWNPWRRGYGRRYWSRPAWYRPTYYRSFRW